MTKVCSICGKPYKKKEFKMGERIFGLELPACNCEAIKFEEEQKRKVEEQRRSKIQDKIKELKKKLNCPLMSPLFEEKSFDRVEKLQDVIGWSSDYKANFQKCIEYAKNFDRYSSGGLFMVGKTGAGKTTLQACIIKELERKGKFCLLIQFSTLLDLMIESINFNVETSIFQYYNTLAQFDYVVLDDIGREKYTEKRLEIAFRIIDNLMNNKVVVSLTGNPECIKKLSSIAEYKAIVDRLKDLCPNEMIFKNESFRGRNVKNF